MFASKMTMRAANCYSSGKWKAGQSAWGRPGVSVWTMGRLVANLYSGRAFDENVTVIVPRDAGLVPAIWAFARSGELEKQVRLLDKKLHVTPNTYGKVPFDEAFWRARADQESPDGLPSPFSDDPTQWLFQGEVAGARLPLQVAIARLLGFRWPDQEPDRLDRLEDSDGVVC